MSSANKRLPNKRPPLPVLRRRVFVFALTVVVAWLFFKLLLWALPFPQLKDFEQRPYSTRIYDKNGELLQVLPLEEGLRREWYSLQEIPPRIVEVFIAAEDEHFYRHGGIDLQAVVRAFFQNVSEKKTVSGASTITMQLARLVVPRNPEKDVTVAVKIKEAWNALRIEAKLDKDKILELYLNNLPFGLQAEGIGSAARTFFGVPPSELSDAQVHALAVIPRRPAKYNPLQNPLVSYEAAIDIGKQTGFYVEQEQWLDQIAMKSRYVYPMRLPHFVLYVHNQYRLAKKIMPPELKLSVSAALTESAENYVNTQLDLHQQARLSHGAALAIDNVTGQILLWSGGNFENDNSGQIDGVTVRNQSGSTMKPFIYAMALENGFSPSDILADVPMDFGSGQVYVPLNFNNQYNGPVLMRTALASSLNIPAVYLLYRLGVDNYMDFLEKLGFDSLQKERERTGLSLALGSGEVTLLELVRAFSVFARGGTVPQLSFEADLKEQKIQAEQIFKKDTTAIICDFLCDRRARSLGFGFAQVFNTPYPAIFKTGTSNQFQNIIALGSTSRYTVGVWMGSHTGETVVQETGSSIPAGVVRKILDYLVQENPSGAEHFSLPQDYAKTDVCALSGMMPSAICPAVTQEFVAIMRRQKPAVCNWHCMENGSIRVSYPQEYQRWLGERNNVGNLFFEGTLEILYPKDGAVFVYDASIPNQAQKIRLDCTGSGELAELYVNGEFFQATTQPFMWFVPLQKGKMNLTVLVPSTQEHKSVTIQVN